MLILDKDEWLTK